MSSHFDAATAALLDLRPPAIAGDAYGGASKISAELAGYLPAMRSADGDLLPSKRDADVRSSEIVLGMTLCPGRRGAV